MATTSHEAVSILKDKEEVSTLLKSLGEFRDNNLAMEAFHALSEILKNKSSSEKSEEIENWISKARRSLQKLLQSKLVETQRNFRLQDLSFEILICLAKLFPINETCLFTEDKIEAEHQVLCSTGYQLDIHQLMKYHLERDYRGSLLGEQHHFKCLLNPHTNAPFHLYDMLHILADASRRQLITIHNKFKFSIEDLKKLIWQQTSIAKKVLDCPSIIQTVYIDNIPNYSSLSKMEFMQIFIQNMVHPILSRHPILTNTVFAKISQIGPRYTTYLKNYAFLYACRVENLLLICELCEAGHIPKNALHLALEYSDLNGFFTILLRPSLFPNALPLLNLLLNEIEDGDSVLMRAVRLGHLEAVPMLLEANVNIHTKDKEGNTPLMLACKQRNLAMIRILLESPAIRSTLDLIGPNNRTVLTNALINEDIELTGILLYAGAHPNIRDANRMFPLMIAMASKKYALPLTHLLLAKGVSVTEPIRYTERERSSTVRPTISVTPLMMLSYDLLSQFFECRQVLIPCINNYIENDPELIRTYKRTSLMLSVLRNDRSDSILKANLEMLNRQDLDGRTALMMAVDNADLDTVRKLLITGARPDIQDNCGYNALMFACQKGDSVIAGWLMKAASILNLTSYVNEQTLLGHTALMIAFQAKQIDRMHRKELMQYLLDNGADPNISTLDGRTVLHEACLEGDLELITLLLEKGAEPKPHCYLSYSPEVVELLKKAEYKHLKQKITAEQLIEKFKTMMSTEEGRNIVNFLLNKKNPEETSEKFIIRYLISVRNHPRLESSEVDRKLQMKLISKYL